MQNFNLQFNQNGETNSFVFTAYYAVFSFACFVKPVFFCCHLFFYHTTLPNASHPVVYVVIVLCFFLSIPYCRWPNELLDCCPGFTSMDCVWFETWSYPHCHNSFWMVGVPNMFDLFYLQSVYGLNFFHRRNMCLYLNVNHVEGLLFLAHLIAWCLSCILWNWRAQNFHIMCVALPNGPQQKSFQFVPWVKTGPEWGSWILLMFVLPPLSVSIKLVKTSWSSAKIVQKITLVAMAT